MTSQQGHSNLHISLLRPPILHILRAAGFHSTKPSVLDALVDITARYIMLLARNTAYYTIAAGDHFPVPQVQDVRLAMQDCGVFRPQMTAADESWLSEEEGGEDMRGLNAFLDWVRGDANGEIMRIAGMAAGKGARSTDIAAATTATGVGEDYLTGMSMDEGAWGRAS